MASDQELHIRSLLGWQGQHGHSEQPFGNAAKAATAAWPQIKSCIFDLFLVGKASMATASSLLGMRRRLPLLHGLRSRAAYSISSWLARPAWPQRAAFWECGEGCHCCMASDQELHIRSLLGWQGQHGHSEQPF